jgi:dipeptidase E
VQQELLLLSSSRTPAGYFTDYLPEIRRFVGGIRRAYFVPFAAVATPWAQYAGMVGDALGLAMDAELATAELVVVGGGNTFQLLRECRQRNLLCSIRERVQSGAKYLGWSAGANLACPTIRTTNDMPIVDPGGLDALALIPFQVNPHYLNVALPGHHGETRDQRLAEFARVNPALPVIGLPEGDWLRVASHEMRGATIELGGPHPAAWFRGSEAPARLAPGWCFGDTA